MTLIAPFQDCFRKILEEVENVFPSKPLPSRHLLDCRNSDVALRSIHDRVKSPFVPNSGPPGEGGVSRFSGPSLGVGRRGGCSGSLWTWTVSAYRETYRYPMLISLAYRHAY